MRWHELTGLVGARCAAGAAFAAILAGQAGAEPPVPLGASPLPDQAELRFCYFAGLAYSPGATVTVAAPIRREVVSDRPRVTLRCVADESAGGRHSWRAIDPDAGDPFRD